MGYYISHMLGIRTGGVFATSRDREDLARRFSKVAIQMEAEGLSVDLYANASALGHCLSQELVAHKGSYVVMAGVFNYWRFEEVSELAKRLSVEFGTEVMLMSWDEEVNKVQCDVFLDGKSLSDVEENPIGRILRRIV